MEARICGIVYERKEKTVYNLHFKSDRRIAVLFNGKRKQFRERFNDYIVSEEKFDGILGMYDESKALLISELIFNESPLFF